MPKPFVRDGAAIEMKACKIAKCNEPGEAGTLDIRSGQLQLIQGWQVSAVESVDQKLVPELPAGIMRLNKVLEISQFLIARLQLRRFQGE